MARDRIPVMRTLAQVSLNDHAEVFDALLNALPQRRGERGEKSMTSNKKKPLRSPASAAKDNI